MTPVSIIMRSFNEGWALRETLPALQRQEFRDWELIVIDSGSSDGSVELIRKANPRHFIQIKPEEYNPSRVMNDGMELARGDFCLFLNADATPVDGRWLRPLVNALQEPQTAAVFGRQIPRHDCRAVFAHDYERCFGPRRESEKWPHFFSMVSSGLRKDVWAKRGFLEKMQYSEDDEYTRWCRSQGYRVIYCPESVVMHSHNYTPRQAYRRSYGEARALAAVWPGRPQEISWGKTFLIGWLNDLRRDLAYCAREARLEEVPHAARIRWQQRRARVSGFHDGWRFYRESATGDGERPRPLGSAENGRAECENTSSRFTLDGSDDLERFLTKLCERIADDVRQVIPPHKLEALVLGGGYGRGQGGVLREKTGDRPYNDLEFYVFLRGNRSLNESAYREQLERLGERLSPQAGLHVEFKIDALDKFRERAVSMFSYDLICGHKIIVGKDDIFHGCERHADSRAIPLSEATRLLLNRCSGLLLVRELLNKPALSEEDADFVGRNLAKAELALGDAVLLAFGQYDWSCLTRRQRLEKLQPCALVAQFSAILRHHAAGVEFKLHPWRNPSSPRPLFPAVEAPNTGLSADFAALHGELCSLASQVWLWLEKRRLNRAFPSIKEYALDRSRKCPETSAWRNVLLSLRTFGVKAAFSPLASRYPRERLFNSLPLLLWNGEVSREPEICHYLQKQLQTSANDRAGLVAAYQQVWPSYG